MADRGDVIAGRFRLEKQIGAGAHGVVFRATELETSRSVAVKVIDPMFAFGSADAQRIEAEAAILADSGAMNYVPIVASVADDAGTVHVVSELCEGEPLDRHLAELEEFGNRARLAMVIETLAPVAETLGRGHGQGLVHGAVKPSNVLLLDPESPIGGGVRLSDFGLSRAPSIDVSTEPSVLRGPASYIAPEVMCGALVDARSDQYALSCIVFRMLTGHPPFQARSALELFQLVTRGPRPTVTASRPELHKAIDRWAADALAIDPIRRYPTVQAMWRDFVACLLKTQSPGLARYRA